MATIGEPASSATAAEDKNETARPLALSSPSVHPAATDVEHQEAQAATGSRSMQCRRKRRRALCCCGCCVTSLVVVGLVILVLALTVFKVKDPRITMNGVWVTAISTGPGAGGVSTVATNATLTADVSVKNPNIASLKFSRSETDVYYKGQTVSVAYVPAGKVGADRTVRMNVTLDLLADRLAAVLNGTGLILGQEYDLTTYTDMRAKVKVLGIYKKSLEIRMNCSIVLDVGGIAGVLVPGAGAASGVQVKGVDCVARVS